MMKTSNNQLNKNEMSKKKDKKKQSITVHGYCFKCDVREFYKPVSGGDPLRMAFDRLAGLKKLREQNAPKCYISGAIAHHDLMERMDTFDRAAAVLEKAGYNPVNPFNNGVPQSEHWTKHMRRDIGLLVQCDFIYMLKGWELSKGAKLELDVASSCGIKVLFEH